MSTLLASRPALVLSSGCGPACPVCRQPGCTHLACRDAFEAGTWADCADCAGSGFDTLEAQIWCPACQGARLVPAEYFVAAGFRIGGAA